MSGKFELEDIEIVPDVNNDSENVQLENTDNEATDLKQSFDIDDGSTTAPLLRRKANIASLIASLFSYIFSPLLVPSYAMMIALNLSYITPVANLKTRIIVLFASFVITCMMPASIIAYLFKAGKISDIGVNNQKDRLIPYIVTIVCYIVCAIYLTEVNTPIWIPGFMIGGGLAALTSMLVNIKWKISAHGAGMGGLMALVFMMWRNGYGLFDYTSVVCAVTLLTGIVCSARIILGRHTLGQVLVGTLNGLFWVALMTI